MRTKSFEIMPYFTADAIVNELFLDDNFTTFEYIYAREILR